MATLPLGGCGLGIAFGPDILEWAGENIHCDATGWLACPHREPGGFVPGTSSTGYRQ